SVNGTKGAVVSGLAATNKFPTGKAVFFSNDAAGTAAGVNILTNPGIAGTADSVSVNLTGTLTPFTPTKNSGSVTPGTVTLSQLGARNFATPGEALALYQLTRQAPLGGTQTIGLTSSGAVGDTAVGGGNNVVSIDGIEFGRPLTAFNISTAGIAP